MLKKKFFLSLFVIFTVILGLVGIYYFTPFRAKKFIPLSKKNVKVTNPYLTFVQEAYQTIQENYWKKLDDNQLTQIFMAAHEKITHQPQLASLQTSKTAYFQFLQGYLKTLPPNKQKQFVVQLVNLTLTNLPPTGRSRLYLKKDEIALKNEVENKTKLNYYQLFGVKPDTKPEVIKKKYQQEKKKLEKEKTPQVKRKLHQIKQAYQTLIDPQAKKRYQQTKIATTVEGELLSPQILHLSITRFSPTTLEDLKRVSQRFDHGDKLDTLILDLRDNIGGAIDGLPYFLGPFIGPNRYAYEFLQQGKKEVYQTKIGWFPSLVRYKKVVILINHNTQSSAEVFASVLKKYNVGVLVGERTRGWGTIERVFPFKHQIDPHEKYSIFLVHHLTLNEDGQPIEGHGIEPTIKISDPQWKNKLFHYFPDHQLITAVDKVWREGN